MLRNVTARYTSVAAAFWKPEMPRFINLGDSVFADYIGAGWDECDAGYRMLRRAGTVKMGGPRNPGERLYMGVFRTTDFRLEVQTGGVQLPTDVVQRGGELTELAVRLPPALLGNPEIEVMLMNNNPEPLKFGYIEVR